MKIAIITTHHKRKSNQIALIKYIEKNMKMNSKIKYTQEDTKTRWKIRDSRTIKHFCDLACIDYDEDYYKYDKYFD